MFEIKPEYGYFELNLEREKCLIQMFALSLNSFESYRVF